GGEPGEPRPGHRPRAAGAGGRRGHRHRRRRLAQPQDHGRGGQRLRRGPHRQALAPFPSVFRAAVDRASASPALAKLLSTIRGTALPSRRCFSTAKTPAVDTPIRRAPMLGWALTFLVVALIAALLGFTTIAGTAM